MLFNAKVFQLSVARLHDHTEHRADVPFRLYILQNIITQVKIGNYSMSNVFK